ncbi:Enoyl-[acyl-carrier-protein] reductase [FMN] [Alloactinosynnema sp. L-07]|uniref:nitronate monooxygenase n=1 Tax=Alloactinosynnema sp. L-07 TaxID=1653480 RepID=UPI00065F0A13|nr:nitronate monooxygenase [Alloactinosynnema sp. L-07]CRK55518.1 Enoyl-[acyl-carrier-protein] reductase [FMN] [Alloactinosynnema sp. L-07]
MIAELTIPVIVAPMAGGPSTPELVAGAVDAGAFAFLAAGYLTADALRAQIDATRALTGKPFGVNLFVPGAESADDLEPYRDLVGREAARLGVEPGNPAWDDDQFAAKLDVVLDARIPVVSFTFGLPSSADLDRLRSAGVVTVATVTTPAEARAARAVDALCVQGGAAGAHRGSFANEVHLYDLLPLLRLIAAETDQPLIATGGLMHGADVAAVIAAGAVAAQLGTAFLRCPEAGTQPAHRAALAAGERDTVVTRAFSGRPARGMANRFIAEYGPHAPAAYPQIHHLTRPVRAAAARAGDQEAMALWAGQGYRLARELPVAEVIDALSHEFEEAVTRLAHRVPRTG